MYMLGTTHKRLLISLVDNQRQIFKRVHVNEWMTEETHSLVPLVNGAQPHYQFALETPPPLFVRRSNVEWKPEGRSASTHSGFKFKFIKNVFDSCREWWPSTSFVIYVFQLKKFPYQWMHLHLSPHAKQWQPCARVVSAKGQTSISVSNIWGHRRL